MAHGKQVSNPAQVKPGSEARLQAPQGLRWPLLLQVPNQARWIRPHNLRLFTLSASCIQTSPGNENTAVTLTASARIKQHPSNQDDLYYNNIPVLPFKQIFSLHASLLLSGEGDYPKTSWGSRRGKKTQRDKAEICCLPSRQQSKMALTP